MGVASDCNLLNVQLFPEGTGGKEGGVGCADVPGVCVGRDGGGGRRVEETTPKRDPAIGVMIQHCDRQRLSQFTVP